MHGDPTVAKVYLSVDTVMLSPKSARKVAMMNLLAAIAFVLVLIGVTTLIIGVIRHFFPSVDQFFPENFKKPLSIQFAAYYLLTGLLILLLLPQA